MLPAQLGGGKHIVKRNGLSADKVRSGFNAYKRNAVMLAYEYTLKLFEVKITLERIFALLVKSFLLQADNIVSAAVFNLADRCSELEVHRHDRARLHIGKREHMLTGPALVNGKEIVLVEYLFYLFAESAIGHAPCIGVVPYHHRAKLLIRHGINSAVGKHIQIAVVRLHTIGIKPRAAYRLHPLLHRKDGGFLNDAYLVHFQRKCFSFVVADFTHYIATFLDIGSEHYDPSLLIIFKPCSLQ